MATIPALLHRVAFYVSIFCFVIVHSRQASSYRDAARQEPGSVAVHASEKCVQNAAPY